MCCGRDNFNTKFRPPLPQTNLTPPSPPFRVSIDMQQQNIRQQQAIQQQNANKVRPRPLHFFNGSR
jgi:hypothetical protein